jgi:hypothetical protein
LLKVTELHSSPFLKQYQGQYTRLTFFAITLKRVLCSDIEENRNPPKRTPARRWPVFY